jgi:hypothetical protein
MNCYELKNIPDLLIDDVKKKLWSSFEFFPLYDSKILCKQLFTNVLTCSNINDKTHMCDDIYYYFDKRNIVEHRDTEKYIQMNSLNNQIHFSCFDELCMFIECSHIVHEQIGAVAIYVDKDKNKHMYKLYNPVYKKLLKLTSSKKFSMNINQFYIELYQKNNLTLFLSHYTSFGNDITYRVNLSFKTLSNNILNLYHATRNKKNTYVYENLTDAYKKIIFEIHGVYITNKHNDDEFAGSRSMTVHDIYYLLKSIDIDFLVRLYKDLLVLKQKKMDDFIDMKCIHLLAQITLM